MTPTAAIQHLLSTGMTETEIGLKVGTHQSTINRIKKGQATTWELGAALVRLAEETPCANDDNASQQAA